MKKLGIILLSLCLTMVVFNFGDTSSAKATSYLTAEQQLDEDEHALYEAVITMLPLACREPDQYSNYENAKRLPGDPSEYRLLEAQFATREDAADLACVKFVRMGKQGGIVEIYYLIMIETYRTKQAEQADLIAAACAAAGGKLLSFFEQKCGNVGEYQPVSLTPEGLESIATTRDCSYVRRINRALDEYWGAQ